MRTLLERNTCFCRSSPSFPTRWKGKAPPPRERAGQHFNSLKTLRLSFFQRKTSSVQKFSFFFSSFKSPPHSLTPVPVAVLLFPSQSRKDLDFSFAGLKNSFRMAVTRAVEEEDARKAQGGAEANADPVAAAAAAGGGGEREGGDDENMSPAASMEKRG